MAKTVDELIVRWPEHVKPGATCDTPTISEDLYATLADIAGARAQPGQPLDGRSLVGELTGKDTRGERDLHWYYPHYSPQPDAQRPLLDSVARQ